MAYTLRLFWAITNMFYSAWFLFFNYAYFCLYEWTTNLLKQSFDKFKGQFRALICFNRDLLGKYTAWVTIWIWSDFAFSISVYKWLQTSIFITSLLTCKLVYRIWNLIEFKDLANKIIEMLTIDYCIEKFPFCNLTVQCHGVKLVPRYMLIVDRKPIEK